MKLQKPIKFNRKIAIKLKDIIVGLFIYRKDIKIIKEANLFDSDWYSYDNIDVIQSGMSPLLHFLLYGASEGRDPRPLFDTKWYINNYPEVEQTGLNPLIYYIKHGLASKHTPHPLFDAEYYLDQYPEVVERKMNPLVHFLRFGWKEDKDPSIFFNVKWYLEKYPDVAESAMNPVEHYIRHGVFENRIPTPYRKVVTIDEDFTNRSYRTYARMLDFKSKLFPGDDLVNHRHCVNFQSIFSYVEENNQKILYQDESINENKLCANRLELKEYVAHLKDVLVIGQSRYIIANDELALHDENATFRSDQRVTLKNLNSLKLDNGKTSIFFFRRPNHRISKAVHLFNEADNNYYHFIVEVLPRLMMINQLEELKDIPLLISKKLHPNLIELLDCLNYRQNQVIEIEKDHGVMVDNLYYPSDLSRILNIYMDETWPTALAVSVKWLKKTVDYIKSNYLKEKTVPYRKIYIKRGKKPYRMLLNEKKIETRMIDLGFEINSCDDMSIESQIKLFSQAKVIVSPTGAAMTNILWCSPNTRVFILMSDHKANQPDIWNCLGEVFDLQINIIQGRRAYEITGLYSVHDNFYIDEKILLSYIS